MKKYIPILLVAIVLNTGCATRTQPNTQADCRYVETDPPAHCHDDRYARSHATEAEQFFGYLVFRIVVESFVHFIVYHH